MRTIPLYRHDSRHPQAQACAACRERGMALFGVLDEAALDDIHVHIADVELPTGSVLFDIGERGHALYTVRTGMVRLERVTARGDRRVVRLAGRGDLIGQEALLQRSHLDAAVACTPVRACRIPRTLVDELSDRHAELMRGLMARWQVAVESSEQWLAELATGPARRRVLHLLLELARHAEDGVLWMPRRAEMGAMLDLTIETTSRIVSSLRREGVISDVDAQHVRLDETRLQAALREQDRG